MNQSHLRKVALALALGLAGCGSADPQPPLAGARIGSDFTLIDQSGRPFASRQLQGQYRILYFGYTYCPDVCPVDVQNLAAGLKRFEAQDAARAARVTPVFITVDPARDTPAVLKEFVSAFHPRLIGLTGTPDQIAAVAKAFAIYFRKGKQTGPGAYLVDHSRQSYLMDPDGKPLALLPIEQSPDAVAGELAKWVK